MVDAQNRLIAYVLKTVSVVRVAKISVVMSNLLDYTTAQGLGRPECRP